MELHEALNNLKSGGTVNRFSDNQLRVLLKQLVETQYNDRKENQLLYYKPVSEVAETIHMCQDRYLGVGGGNGASKTETILAELCMLATGIFPTGLKPEVLAGIREKFRGPIAVRVVVESLTTTLTPIILPKLQWWKWSGADEAGGERGHWGWIPRRALIQGNWTASWREKLRILRVHCYDPDNPDKIIGESTFQFMAHTQDPSDFASGDFHHILHDELTTHAIWRENEARTMRVGGRIALAMTWPDDPSIPVDWVFDSLYEKGREGPQKVQGVSWFEMWTQDNKNLDQASVAEQAGMWAENIRNVRLKGQPIRFSNRVHPLFTELPQTWCLPCHTAKMVTEQCPVCGAEGDQLVDFCHVEDFHAETSLPTIMLLDPHPRKPHMALWAQIDSWDDIWIVAEALVEGGPEEMESVSAATETEYGLRVVSRIGDPNMLRSPSGAKRGVTWQDEFSDCGLNMDLGDTSDVGRSRLNDYLKVDPDRKSPRIHIHSRCTQTIRQLQRYVWDDYRNVADRAMKQVPKDKEDDFPTLLKYLLNSEPSYDILTRGAQVIRTRG
jgi:hypothetical protein